MKTCGSVQREVVYDTQGIANRAHDKLNRRMDRP